MLATVEDRWRAANVSRVLVSIKSEVNCLLPSLL